MVTWSSPLTATPFLTGWSSPALGWGGSSPAVAPSWPAAEPAQLPWAADADALALGTRLSPDLAAALPGLFARGTMDPSAASPLAAEVALLRSVLGASEQRLDPTALAGQLGATSCGFPGANGLPGTNGFPGATNCGFPGANGFPGATGFPGGLDAELASLILAFLMSVLGQLMQSRDLGALSPAAGSGSAGGSGGGSGGAGSGGSGSTGSGSGGVPSGSVPSTTPTTATPSLPPGTGLGGLKVEVIGDSLMVGAASKTKGALEGAGAAGVDIDAQVGRSINGSGSGVNVTPAEIAARAKASGANVVVVELGTNHSNYAKFIPETMNELSKLQPPPMVVWVNTQTQRPGQSNYPQSYYDENRRINDLIAAEAARRPNMAVADWASIAGQPGINAGDGLHLTARGSQALADLITQTIARARAAQG